jgi:hypothetical protein
MLLARRVLGAAIACLNARRTSSLGNDGTRAVHMRFQAAAVALRMRSYGGVFAHTNRSEIWTDGANFYAVRLRTVL